MMELVEGLGQGQNLAKPFLLFSAHKRHVRNVERIKSFPTITVVDGETLFSPQGLCG